MEDTQMGLKRLRKISGNTPTYFCENCKCSRYSPCYCPKKDKGK